MPSLKDKTTDRTVNSNGCGTTSPLTQTRTTTRRKLSLFARSTTKTANERCDTVYSTKRHLSAHCRPDKTPPWTTKRKNEEMQMVFDRLKIRNVSWINVQNCAENYTVQGRLSSREYNTSYIQTAPQRNSKLVLSKPPILNSRHFLKMVLPINFSNGCSV